MNQEHSNTLSAPADDSNPWEASASAPETDAWEADSAQAADANPWEAATQETQNENPWETGTTDAAESNPWDAGTTEPAAAAESSSESWLEAAPADAADDPGFDLLNPFNEALIPLDVWVDQGLDYVVEHARPAFQAIRLPIDATLTGIESALLAVPSLVMLAILGLLAWQAGGRRLALGTVISFSLIGMIGAWPEAMVTLSLVLTSVAFCVLIGLPLGIAVARSDRLESLVRPALDAMQTTPAFVYLVPVVMLFGIGNVPGVVVTIVFALPPLIRLTNLGIRQVRPDLIEASRSFGASPWQMLCKVQLPLAMPTIMAGVNQTLMLSLSMVVIASMIAVGGLGQMVLRGIGRLDMGLATVGGLGIVLMAIVLDRITQNMGRARTAGDRSVRRRWTERGPVGLARALLARGKTTAEPDANARTASHSTSS